MSETKPQIILTSVVMIVFLFIMIFQPTVKPEKEIIVKQPVINIDDLASAIAEKIEVQVIDVNKIIEKTAMPELLKYTSDYDLLIKIVYLEAKDQSLDGKTEVVKAILNRVESDSFPNTIREVVLEKGQFQPAYLLGGVELQEKYVPEIKSAIEKSFETESESLFFVNPDIADPDAYYWMKTNLKYIKTIEDHEFYGY